MSEAKLNWSGAEVQDGKLTVPLEGETGEDWQHTFAGTVRRLRHSSQWGKVALDEESVSVSDVRPGSEEKLRHYLDSVVTQANASNQPDEPESGPDAEEADQDEGQGTDEDRGDAGPDAQMQERFRSFRDGDGDGDGDA